MPKANAKWGVNVYICELSRFLPWGDSHDYEHYANKDHDLACSSDCSHFIVKALRSYIVFATANDKLLRQLKYVEIANTTMNNKGVSY